LKEKRREKYEARFKGKLKATEEELESQKEERVCATLFPLFEYDFEVVC
jgi:hypothetical protein